MRRGLALLCAIAVLVVLTPARASAATTLTSITLVPGSPSTGALGIDYAIAFSGGQYAKCVRVHFSSTTTFGGGSLPSSMAFASPALLANGVGWTTATSGDYVQGTFGPGDTPNGGTALRINGINNPTASGTYFAEIDAYSDTGCSTLVETGVVAFDIHNYTVLSAAVDPSLGFTVANRATTCNGESNLLSSAGNSTGVAFGRITLSTNVSGAQALTVTGNSAGGFSVYIRGMQTTTNMRNAGHNWADVAGTYPTGALIGSGERFGYTYNDSTTSSNVTNPASANFIKLDSTDRTIMGSTTSSSGTGCVTFAAQTDAVTPAGAYDATVIYTVVPTY